MAFSKQPLFLHEEVMLLALRDETGTVSFTSMHQYALAGALVAELLLRERIAVEPGKRQLVNVIDDDPLGDALLDECLRRMRDVKRRKTIENWVSAFVHIRKLHHRVAQGLCKRGILRADERTILLIFRRTVYPEINPRPERQLVERLRKAIFSETPRVDPRTAVLISLANSADLLRIPFDRRELKRRKQRIKQLTSGELMGKATKQAIEAAQMAVVAASVAASAAATTAATAAT